MSSTVQVQKSRWRYLDAYLIDAGAGKSGVASGTPTVTYKKYGRDILLYQSRHLSLGRS